MPQKRLKIAKNSPVGRVYTAYGDLGGNVFWTEFPHALALKLLIFLPFRWLFWCGFDDNNLRIPKILLAISFILGYFNPSFLVAVAVLLVSIGLCWAITMALNTEYIKDNVFSEGGD